MVSCILGVVYKTGGFVGEGVWLREGVIPLLSSVPFSETISPGAIPNAQNACRILLYAITDFYNCSAITKNDCF